MKYIFTLTLLLLMSAVLHAEQLSYSPKPIPAPTTPQIVMEVQNEENISSKRVKAQLNEMSKELEQETEVSIVIIYYVKHNRSAEALQTANQIKKFLTNKQKIESKRIYVINGGDKGMVKIKVYFVPPEAVEPNNNQTSRSMYVPNAQTKQKKQNKVNPIVQTENSLF